MDLEFNGYLKTRVMGVGVKEERDVLLHNAIWRKDRVLIYCISCEV